MSQKFRIILSLVLCLSIILSAYTPAFAMSKRPELSSRDSDGRFIRDPFEQGDAFRYGGLFGPLEEPDAYYYYNRYKEGVSARDMGFAVGEPHYIPIARENSL